jgi:hypothetical protein
MNKIKETKIDCKDLKVFDINSKNKLFSKENCLLVKSTVLLDATTNDGPQFLEGRKSWCVYIDYVDIKFVLSRSNVLLSMNDNDNIKYSGEALIMSNKLEGTGELHETK